MEISVDVSCRELARFFDLTVSFASYISEECCKLEEALAKLKTSSSPEEMDQIDQDVKRVKIILADSEQDLQCLSQKIYEYERFVSRLKLAAGSNVSSTQADRVLDIRSDLQNLRHTNQSYSIVEVNGQTMSVYDHPQSLGKNLKYEQGNNDLHKAGTCSLVASTNIMKIGGVDESENSIVKNATLWGLCSRSGGTNTSFSQLSKILSRYGIKTNNSSTSTPDQLATIVETGHGVIISVDSDILWDEPSMKVFPVVDHAVTVTSVARNPNSGIIEGFYICDSGRCMSSDASKFVDMRTMNRAHFHARNHGVLFTKNIIW